MTVAHLEQRRGYFISPLYELLNERQPRFDTQQYNTVLICFPLPYR